ncbi:hypothetical protein GX586_05725 [bacterium]|nr:hypothetical protein [bacterium]
MNIRWADILRTGARVLACLLLFAAPLKFGIAEAGIGVDMPKSAGEFIFFSFPNTIAHGMIVVIGILCSVALLTGKREAGGGVAFWAGAGWAVLLVGMLWADRTLPPEWRNDDIRTQFVVYGVWFLCAATLFADEQAGRAAAVCVILGGCFASITGIQQSAGVLAATREYAAMEAGFANFTAYTNHLFSTPIDPQTVLWVKKLTSDRVSGTFIYPNALGGFIIVMLPLCAAIVAGAPMRLMRVLGGMGFVLGAVALFLSKSKASIAIAGVMLMALIWLSRRAGATSRRTAVVAAAVCALVAAAMLAGGYGARLDDRLRATGGARIEYWRAAATIIGKKPVRGWGTGGFTRLYPLYRRKGAEDARLAHNVVLNLWTDYGLLGLLGGAMALAMPLGVAWARQLRQRSALPSAPVAAQGAHPAFSWLHAAGLVAATGFVLHCLVDFDFNIMGITVPALLALAIASARQNPTTPHAR